MFDPDDTPDTQLYHIGRALIDRGKLTEAIEVLRASAALFPHPKTLEVLADCEWQSNDRARAIEHAALAHVLGPGSRPAVMLAEHLLSIGEKRRAREVIEIGRQRDPQRNDFARLAALAAE